LQSIQEVAVRFPGESYINFENWHRSIDPQHPRSTVYEWTAKPFNGKVHEDKSDIRTKDVHLVRPNMMNVKFCVVSQRLHRTKRTLYIYRHSK